jgi:hypothetical protein
MSTVLSESTLKKIEAFRKDAEKHYEEFVKLHINDKCDFAGCDLWSACSKCNGLYHDHNLKCKEWKWLWTMSVGPHDDR